MSSKTDAMVKLSLVFVISLLSFAIGTFVGKKYSDNQHQLAVLEPSGANREVASVEEGSDEGIEAKTEKTGTMSDEEIAKLAEEFVTDEKEVPAKEVAQSETKEEHGAAVEEHGEEHAAPTKTVKAEKEVHGKAAAHEEKVEHVVAKEEHAPVKGRVPSSLPKDVAQYSVGKFTVQVASYASEGEAQKMASDLKKKGYSAFYIPANVKGKTWYRVSVGQFATQKEAQNYRGDLMNKAKVSTAIVQKITE